jgi:hypothetical protein
MYEVNIFIWQGEKSLVFYAARKWYFFGLIYIYIPVYLAYIIHRQKVFKISKALSRYSSSLHIFISSQ